MGTHHSASWGARIVSVLLLVVLGTPAAIGMAVALSRIITRILILFQTDLGGMALPLVALVGCGLLLTVVTLVATRQSGLGALVAGALTTVLAGGAVVAGPSLSRTSIIRDILQAFGREGVTALTLVMTGALLPVGAVLLGLGMAFALSRRSRPSSSVAAAVAVGTVPLALLAFTGAAFGMTRLYLRTGQVGFASSAWRDSRFVLALLLLAGAALVLGAVAALGGRGPWGLVVSGVLIAVPSVLFTVFLPQVVRVVQLPRWAYELTNSATLSAAPLVGAILVGGGLGLVWRRRSARPETPGAVPPTPPPHVTSSHRA